MSRASKKIVWITGAASGIGYACAERFAAEGYLVVGSDINPCKQWQSIEELSSGSCFRLLDVTLEQAVTDFAGALIADFGAIDVVITAAGVAGGGAIHHISTADWDHVINVNLRGTMLCIRAAIPQMIEQRSGNIITIASVEGLEGSEGGSAYNASKGGVVMFTKNLAMDYGRIGIRANAICPGFIDTPMFREVMDLEAMRETRDKIQAQHKLGRFGRSQEIAGAAWFLAGEDSSFITGHALPVDGGYVAGHSYGLTEMMGLV